MKLSECVTPDCGAPIKATSLYCVRHGGAGECLHLLVYTENALNMDRHIPGFSATVTDHSLGHFYDVCQVCGCIKREYQAFAALPFDDDATPHEVAMANRSKAFGTKYRMERKRKTVAA